MSRLFSQEWFYQAFSGSDCEVQCSITGIHLFAYGNATPEQKSELDIGNDRLKISMNIDASDFSPYIILGDVLDERRRIFDETDDKTAYSALSRMVREQYGMGIISYWHERINRDIPGYRPLNDRETGLVQKMLSEPTYRDWIFYSPCEAMNALDRVAAKIAADLDKMSIPDPDVLDWMCCISEMKRKILVYGLPTITDPNMFYGIELSRLGLSVKLYYIQFSYGLSEALSITQDGTLKPVMITRRSNMLSSRMPYLSCAESARRWSIDEKTVHEWIRRGEIRSAVRDGQEWKILSDTKRPGGQFTTQTYYPIRDRSPEAANDYSFLSALPAKKPFQISANEDGTYNVKSVPDGTTETAGPSVAILSREEREHFEFYLLQSDWIQWDMHKHMMIIRQESETTD